MSDINVIVQETPINVSVTPNAVIQINIDEAGVQGPKGIDGIAGTGSSTQNLNGLITTGVADLRYYPLSTNPSGYLTGLSFIKHADFNHNSFIFVGDGAGGGLNNLSSVGVGVDALGSADGLAYNTAVGDSSMAVLTTGGNNTAVGEESMVSYVNGRQNTALGGEALAGATHGNNNTAVGFQAGAYSIDGGHDNIMLGIFAGGGLGTNSSNNILIGNQGQSTDNNIIRVGTNGTHQITYIAGDVKFDNLTNTGALIIQLSGQLNQTGTNLNNKINSLSGYINNSNVNHIIYTTGNQTINGNKTFISDTYFTSGIIRNTANLDYNFIDLTNDGTITMQAGQGTGNGSESILILSDGLGYSRTYGFFTLHLDDFTTIFDIDSNSGGNPTISFAGNGSPTILLNQFAGFDITDSTIKVDGAAGHFGSNGNRYGRSLILQAENNEHTGNGGNIILTPGDGTVRGSVLINGALGITGAITGVVGTTPNRIYLNNLGELNIVAGSDVDFGDFDLNLNASNYINLNGNGITLNSPVTFSFPIRDAGGAIASVDTNNRQLLDNNTTATLDWNNKSLIGNWGAITCNALSTNALTIDSVDLNSNGIGTLSTDSFMVINNVAINNNAPVSNLDVSGNINSSGIISQNHISNNNLNLISKSNNTGIILSGNDINFYGNTSGTAPSTRTWTIPLSEPIYGTTGAILGKPDGFWQILVSGRVAKVPYYF